MKKFGFTLAEVLITLTIIGVVAAVTLPALQQNMSNRGLEAQTSKFYRNLSEAVGRYMADNELGSLTTAFQSDMDDFIKKNFKISKACTNIADAGCFAGSYSYFNGSTGLVFKDDAYKYKYALIDGSTIAFQEPASGADEVAIILVDVNGVKKPNRIGYDTWKMYVYSDGSIDDYKITPKVRLTTGSGGIDDSISNNFTNCSTKKAEYGCLATFIRNGYKFDSNWQ